MPNSAVPPLPFLTPPAVRAAVGRAAPAVLMATIAAGLVTFLALSSLPPRYIAQATLAVVIPADATGAGGTHGGTAAEILSGHVRSLRDPELLLAVARESELQDSSRRFSPGGWHGWALALLSRAGLMHDSGVRPPVSDAGQQLEIAKHLQIAATPAGTIEVRFDAWQPDLAAGFVNRLLEAYITRLKQNAIDRSLLPQLHAQRLSADEARAAAEQERLLLQSLRDVGGDTQSLEARLAEVRAELSKAEKSQAAAEARLAAARSITPASSVNSADVAAFPAVQALLKQQARIAKQLGEVAAGKGAGPTDLTADFAILRKKIAAEIGAGVRLREAEVRGGLERIVTLRQRVAQINQQAAAAREQELRYANAVDFAKTREAEAVGLEQRLQAQSEGALRRVGLVQPVAEAQVPSVPVPPRRAPPALSAMAVTLLLGLGLAVGRGVIGQGARTTAGLSAEPPASAHDSDTGEAHSLEHDRFAAVGSVRAVANALLMRSGAHGGFRTLVANERPGEAADEEALQLATALGHAGRQVVLIKWDLEGTDLARLNGPLRLLGFNDLLVGGACFEEIIRALDTKAVHVIEAGSAVKDKTAALNPDRLNIVLDALDEVYDHVVIAAQHEEARNLFAAMQGRFDACLSIPCLEDDPGTLAAGVNVFLGFEVTGIDVIRLERPARAANPGPRLAFGRARAADSSSV